MTMTPSDAELVRAYATEGSEPAFRGLVARHVDLVYATALRQLGDRQTAEEVVQNVFVALARKAPRLGGIETLAGWLHRTTILEARARIRAELRRRRRDEAAAELARIQHEGAPALDALVPLLDEALLNLRDGDRIALVLRFLENRSLRDVGGVLGIEEDAARKRVSRALDRLTDFFRSRGFVLGAGAVPLLSNCVQSAPASLAVASAKAGIAAGGAASGVKLVLFHLMSLSKTQTAVICALLAAAPITVQWRTSSAVAGEQNELSRSMVAARNQLASLDGELQAIRAARLRTQNETLNIQTRTSAVIARRAGRSPRERYQWDDSSPVLRVPKQFLEQIDMTAVNRGGILTDTIRELLQITDPEAERVQAGIDRFLDGYYSAQRQRMRLVPATRSDLQGRTAEDTRVFELKAIGPRMDELRDQLFAELGSVLGPDRFRMFRDALSNWMPVDNEYHGMNTGMEVFNHDRRERFYRPEPGAGGIVWSFNSPAGHTSMNLTLEPDQISPLIRPHIEDWISLAKAAATPVPATDSK